MPPKLLSLFKDPLEKKITMSEIGGVILTSATEMLFRKLVSSDLLQFAKQEQIRSEIKKWEKLLMKINDVLDDAEEKQITHQSVKVWLRDLQNLAFHVEDMLDEFQTEALRRKLQLSQPSTSKFWKVVRANLSPRSIKFNFMMISRIKTITARFQDIVKEKDMLDLKENSTRKCWKVGQRLPTTSLVNEDKVCGREKDKKEIVQNLLRDDWRRDDGFSVIAIVGMGGVGKTTLAQVVYNDDRVNNHFDLKAWVCISEDFDVIRVTKTILSSIADNHLDGDDDLNLLQTKLRKKLRGKKFLFILDDMWNENYNDWTALSCAFEAGSPGSKIVVTARNRGVAVMMATVQTYQLKELSADDCLCVFTQHSLGTKDFCMPHSLQEIGKKIVKKCNGLPLAAKTLGGLLRGRHDPSDWKDVLNSKIWDLPEDISEIIPALRISYHYLSPCLKQCFAYCSLFPKNYEFQVEEMILLWMAEGFLHQENSEKQMEDLGRKCFHELHSRSFFQQSSNDISRFVMHDLINDLAQWAAGEIYFRMEDTLECKRKQKLFENLRHLSYIRGRYDGMKRFKALFNIKHLQTFLPIELSDTWSREGYLSYSFFHNLSKLQRLRVLSFNGYCIFKLPSSIGKLKHLRYLNLSETRIKTLPESVNNLYNLETLLLEDCHRLKKLCADMGNLIKLRYLNNSNVENLEQMPLRIGKLTCLQMLCCFVVGKNIGSRLRELKFLMQLQGTLKISRLENVKVVSDAMEAEINGKGYLKALLLEWSRSSSDLREPGIETHVLDMLKPHRNLEELDIRDYGGTKFPIWFEDCSLSNLVLLKLKFCSRCTSLPSVGHLPCLKHLFITGMDAVKTVGQEFCENGSSVAFPSLETICFEDMQKWENWICHGSGKTVDDFPHLRELSLVNCSQLLGTLPEPLPVLESLVIESCEQLLVSIPSLPTLRKLEISGCKGVKWRSTIDLSSLNSVVCRDMLDRVFLTKLLKQELPNLEELEIEDCEELTCLWKNEIELLQDISSMVVEEQQDQQHEMLPRKLQCLKVRRCQSLVKLPQALFALSSLRDIEIFDCNSFVSFPEAALPSQLKKLTIMECNALDALPEAWMHNTNPPLESLYIGCCNSLTHIARMQLPLGIKRLEIKNCHNIRTLIEKGGIHNDSERYTSLLEQLIIGFCPNLEYLDELPATLKLLDIGNCSKLTFLSRSYLPEALKYLCIYGCVKLESIAKKLDNATSLEIIMISACNNLKLLPDGLWKLCHLLEICISDCPNLVSFCKGRLLSTKLTKLRINGCEKLEALPNCMHLLTSLQNLEIGHCPSILSFPEFGFPTNLTSLGIFDKNCKPFFNWGLSRFTALKQFSIGNCLDVVSFPEEREITLPASLTVLEIFNFPNLESLSSKIENHSSLESLRLSGCLKLRFFPKNGLPSSLLQLYIESCPLIEEKTRKDRGEYWYMINHIPYVSVNHSCVFDYSSEED